MKLHIEAIKAAIEAQVPTYYVDVPDNASYPYVLLWGTPGDPGIEASIEGDTDMSDLLGVTVADTTPENVLHTVGIVRGILTGLRPAVTGRQVWLVFKYSNTVQPDKSITLPETNSHPFYAVDRWQLIDTVGDTA